MSKNIRAKQRGGALIEFLIFLPVVLVLISGVIDVTIGINEYTNQLAAGRAVARTVSRATIERPELNNAEIILPFAIATSEFFLTQNRLNPQDFKIDSSIKKITNHDGMATFGYLIGLSIRRKPQGIVSFLRSFMVSQCTAVSFRIESNIDLEGEDSQSDLCIES